MVLKLSQTLISLLNHMEVHLDWMSTKHILDHVMYFFKNKYLMRGFKNLVFQTCCSMRNENVKTGGFESFNLVHTRG